jgi:alpha-tubulin suppressor-like RCC1 family protein
MTKKIAIVLLICVICGLFGLGAKSCTNRNSSKTKSGGSDYNTFIINAPSNLSATAVSYSEIRLSWQDNSNNENGFEIERATSAEGGSASGGGYLLLATVSANTTLYSDIVLTPFTTYYYRIRSFNTIGDTSIYSNAVSISLRPSGWLAVTLGETYTIALANDRTLWGWGNNSSAQVNPANSALTIIRPVLLTNDVDWSNICSGYYHALAIKTDGVLWSWGDNSYGQLGIGNTNSVFALSRIGTVSDWTFSAGGEYHTIAIKTDDTLWAWGDNTYGQLGQGDIIERNTPTQIGSLSDWSSIASGGRHNLGIKTNGTLWTWGWGYWGQLGNGAGDPTGGSTTNIIEPTPLSIGTDSDWSTEQNVGISANYTQSYVLKTTGTLWAWGQNYSNTPGQVGTDTDWAMITAGGGDPNSTYRLARKNNGTLWTWGFNNYGQLGWGDTGYAEKTILTQIITPLVWSTVSAGGYHNAGIATDGNIWVWGRNDYYQLGLNDPINRTIPYPFGSLSAPSSLFAMVISSSQINLAWTDNSDNETGFKIERKFNRNGTFEQIATCGIDAILYSDTGPFYAGTYYYRVRAYNNDSNSEYSYEAFNALSGNWSAIAAGGYHAVALKNGNTLWVWGPNWYGQLGFEDMNDRLFPTMLVPDSDWSIPVCGAYYTLARKTNGILWGWGDNSTGQLGTDDGIDPRFTPGQCAMATADWFVIVAGAMHALALKTDKTLWAWGSNGAGELGINDTDQRNSPTQSFITTQDWSAIAAGEGHSLALKIDNTLWTWGYNYDGQLGLGNSGWTTERKTPTQVGNNSDWFMIAAGGAYCIALKTNRTLWAWGANSNGQLGDGTNTRRTTPRQVFGSTSDWSVISAGFNHTIALKTDKTLWAWGDNEFGELGTNDGIARYTPTQCVMTTQDWFTIAAGLQYTIALKTNMTLWAWGYNSNGQIGVGDYNGRNTPVIVGE